MDGNHGCSASASALAALLVLATDASAAHAAPVVEDELVAFLAFEDGNGGVAVDTTGNGHDAELVGASWCAGCAAVPSEGALLRVSAGPSMQGDSFTYDLWFEAGSTSGMGRILAQAFAVGGEGPDVLERYGSSIAIRINNQGAVFEEPTVGSRSNDGPPDHWGTCDTPFHRNDGPEHLVITHDGGAKMVRIFIGLEGEPLRLCFEAAYTGPYDVDSGPLALGNLPSGDRFFASKFYQFTYYDQPLSHSVGGDNVVNGGEILVNHLAGSQPDLPTSLTADAGVPDASPEDPQDPDADGMPAGDDAAPADLDRDGGVEGMAATTLTGGCSSTPRPVTWPWLALLAVAGALRRRSQHPEMVLDPSVDGGSDTVETVRLTPTP